MPRYEVHGWGRDTGRRRKGRYDVADEEAAIFRAGDDGIVVETVKRVPDPPATEPQIAYAKSLGLTFSEAITKEEMSDLLSCHIERDKPATDRHRFFAEGFGVRHTLHTGKRDLFGRIFEQLKRSGRTEDLAAWFVYRVCRSLFRGTDPAGVTGPESAVIREIARRLASEETVMRSIVRYEGPDVIRFGEWVDSRYGGVHRGGSNRTAAYQRAVEELRRRLGT
jgi:hypothetical protein